MRNTKSARRAADGPSLAYRRPEKAPTKPPPVGPRGVLGPDDRCWNAFPEQDEDLDRARARYFDSEQVYERVLGVKRRIDPDDVFTANRLCVGASRKFGSTAGSS